MLSSSSAAQSAIQQRIATFLSAHELLNLPELLAEAQQYQGNARDLLFMLCFFEDRFPSLLTADNVSRLFKYPDISDLRELTRYSMARGEELFTYILNGQGPAESEDESSKPRGETSSEEVKLILSIARRLEGLGLARRDIDLIALDAIPEDANRYWGIFTLWKAADQTMDNGAPLFTAKHVFRLISLAEDTYDNTQVYHLKNLFERLLAHRVLTLDTLDIIFERMQRWLGLEDISTSLQKFAEQDQLNFATAKLACKLENEETTELYLKLKHTATKDQWQLLEPWLLTRINNFKEIDEHCEVLIKLINRDMFSEPNLKRIMKAQCPSDALESILRPAQRRLTPSPTTEATLLRLHQLNANSGRHPDKENDDKETPDP